MIRALYSLKSKLLIAVLPFLAILTVLTVWLVSAYVRDSVRADLQQQQTTLVTLMARKLDDQFAGYQKTIASFAKQLPVAALNDTTALERFIDSRPALREMFDNNVVIFSADGVLLAEAAQRPSRTGTDFSYRDYIKRTRQQWRPIISQPFQSTLPHKPLVVMFTVPVFDHAGRPRAIVGGSINLLRPNLLGALATTPLGKHGYFYLSDRSRTMIMHPDPARLLKPVAPAGADLLYDKAVQGFEGGG
jgi:two-component system NtrC family sensor kinase